MAMRCLIALTFLAAGAAQAAPPGEGTVYITGATVIHPDRTGPDAVQPHTSLIIHGGRITAVLQNVTFELPQGATVINAYGKYVVPGLVDSHVHFFQSGNLYTRPDAMDFNAVVPYADEVARNKARLDATLRVWLANGVTGVVDIGGPFWNFDVRDRALLTAAAPRMAVAGPLISMVDRPQLDLGDPPIIRIDSPEAARALVARQLPRKPDYIKVWFIHQDGDDLAAQEAIVKAAGDAAHEAGIKLAVHATELLVAKAALRAGADLLVHSVFDRMVDGEFLVLMKQKNAVYCPTLFVISGYPLALSNTWQATPEETSRADPQILAAMDDLNEIPADKLPPRVAQLMAKPPTVSLPSVALANLSLVDAAGIPIAMGTDAGNIGTLHGPSIHREMKLMIEAGLTPLEVLRSATVNGAYLLGLAGKTGVIAEGAFADLVILDADPLADIGNLARVHRVLKDGVVYDPEKLMQSIR